MGRRGDGARATHEDRRGDEGIVAGQHGEIGWTASKYFEGVGVEGTDRLLETGDVRMRGEFEKRLGVETSSGPIGNVVGDDRHRALVGDDSEVLDDCPDRGSGVVRHHNERTGDRCPLGRRDVDQPRHLGDGR